MITDIVDSLGSDGVSRSKQLCYTSLSEFIDTASQLLTVYMQHPGVLFIVNICTTAVISHASFLSPHIADCCLYSMLPLLTLGQSLPISV